VTRRVKVKGHLIRCCDAHLIGPWHENMHAITAIIIIMLVLLCSTLSVLHAHVPSPRSHAAAAGAHDTLFAACGDNYT
jgi:hypothetical protein